MVDPPQIIRMEIVEELPTADEGQPVFLRVQRLKCRNVRDDGSVSPVFRVDLVDRPKMDGVAVLVYRRVAQGHDRSRIEVLTRESLRPAAYFRQGKKKPLEDPLRYLTVEEVVAGLLEDEDHGEEGILRRAAIEVHEEAAIDVPLDRIRFLGGPLFLSPGILSEKLYFTCADATGLAQGTPRGDGSPLEEGGRTRWLPLDALAIACRSGELFDAKTEIAATRALALGLP